MESRKVLKEQYKRSKPDMGVFAFKSLKSGKCLVEATGDLKSAMNSARFQLDFGNYRNSELQAQWKEDGPAAFSLEILEILPYDKDESKTDYGEELAILKMMWEERLVEEGMVCYGC